MEKEKVMEALEDWIMRVTNEKTMATAEEIAALPEVARVCLDYFRYFDASQNKKPNADRVGLKLKSDDILSQAQIEELLAKS